MAPVKRKSKAAKTKTAARAKAAKPKARKAAKPKTRKKAAKPRPRSPPLAVARSHCIATDPFGDPCQSARRLPSQYCTIHSYLER
jgi:hypothetical protein